MFYNLKKDGYKNKQLLLFFAMYSMFAIVFGKMYTVLMYGRGNIITAGLSSYGGLFGVVIASIIFERIISTDKSVIKYTILSLPLNLFKNILFLYINQITIHYHFIINK